MIAALLGWTKWPQWALELLVIAGLAGGFWLYHRHVYDTGIAAQRMADNAASADIEARAAAATEAAQDAANRAEDSYREEIAHNSALAAARPIGPVRLCIDAYPGSSGVSKAAPVVARTPSSGSSSWSLPGVSGGDSGVRTNRAGPDLAELLSAWAQKADSVSATLREYQSSNQR